MDSLKLKTCELWWNGPKFLMSNQYPQRQIPVAVIKDPAVHLDIVTDLTSNAFIATLKRFIFRRGKCAKLYSDNATNFVGANIELKKMFNLVCKPDEALASYMASEGIDWKFLPPRAPNFGGLWEAGVKSFKFYLKRVVGNIRLTYEEFLTVIIQIEGMLNSRPLVPLSSDLDDLNVLTPSHFLIGRSITSIVEPDLTNLNEIGWIIGRKLQK
ncbi:integrase catalytic domain-containing protein [Trichonephila clavipes]|nr:integrase catalytic domain-containing protein [Trichonephila clavipes]